MVKIAPSVLSADFSKLGDEIKSAEQGGADWIHLDVMDGQFVPNLTFGPLVVKGIRKLTALPLDAHLMMFSADEFIPIFHKVGVDRITVHVEACPHLWRTLDLIHSLGLKAGITKNPATPISQIEPVLDQVELVLVMSVEPGFGGQKFISKSLQEISQLDRLKSEKNLNFEIQVDGGIDMTTAVQVANAGATVLVAGNSIFNTEDPATAVKNLRKIVNR